jgi:predicted enzyme related to lactoylglutathione lyase
MDIPNTGRFAMLLDPQGAAFAIIKLTMPQA